MAIKCIKILSNLRIKGIKGMQSADWSLQALVETKAWVSTALRYLVYVSSTDSQTLLRIFWTARKSNQLILKEMKFFGKTDVEAQAPIQTPDGKNWLIWKDPNSGQDWGQEEKGMTEDEMVGWYHWLNGHEFEQTQGVGDGQGSLACCSPWGHRVSDMTEQLNNSNSWKDRQERQGTSCLVKMEVHQECSRQLILLTGNLVVTHHAFSSFPLFLYTWHSHWSVCVCVFMCLL